MALDFPDTRRAAPRPHPGFSLPTSQLRLHLRGKPPAEAKAWPSFAPDPAPFASPRAQPNIATPPRSEKFPAQIFRSSGRGRHREGTPPPPAKELLEQVSPSPAGRAIPEAKSAPSIILHHRRHQPRRKVLCHAVQRGVLLFKKVLNAVGV